MGVIQNVYCVPKRAGAVPWAALLGGLQQRGCVSGSFWAGSAFEKGGDRRYPRNPEVLSFEHIESRLADLAPAVDVAANLPDAVIHVFAEARTYRREPQLFYPGGAELGLYRFGGGHHLVVGKPDDFSDIARQDPELYESIKPASLDPAWEGTVEELLWLSGKNAPLLEDFIGSPFHVFLESLWPDHLVVEDCVP